MRKDTAYRERYEAWIANEAQREAQHSQVARTNRERREAAEREAAVAQRAAEKQRKVERNERVLANLNDMPIVQISSYYENAMKLWQNTPISGYVIPKAYAALRYKSMRHRGFTGVLRAVVRLVQQGFGHHPDHEHYADVPQPERSAILIEMETALAEYGELDAGTTLKTSDRWLDSIHARQRREAEELRRREEEARRAARQAQMQIDLRERPVVFERDPEGSINLAAFATDRQSVHRSSVQSATQKAVATLLLRPLVLGQDTLPEIIEQFQSVRWYGERAMERTAMELTNDYFNTEAFSVRYGDALDHVWAYIREHVHKNELTLRLAQETAEGIGMCSNGKMARLVNVLQGYDETLEAEKPKELFQAAIALLMNQPLEEREPAARSLFTEYNIPEAEHAVWLEPLLEV